MEALQIKTFPSPILRKAAKPLKQFGQKEQDILENMAKAMYENQGVGLAAPQVGLSLRLAVVDTSNSLIKLVNPRILKREGAETGDEGCLSIPGACVKVKRAKKILIEFMDPGGNKATLEAQGLLARAIQHEIDHLNGRLILDYLNPIKRFFLKRRLCC